MRSLGWSMALLLVGCATRPSELSRTGPATVVSASDPGETLAWLRGEMARVRRTPPEESYTPSGWRGRDVSPLIGTSRQAITDALGVPDVCPTPDGSPCPFGGQVVYRFYRLYQQLGGGPHLVLSFDQAHTCTSARWVGTK